MGGDWELGGNGNKNKAVPVTTDASSNAANASMKHPRKAKGGSKYDFVKVRVWLGEHWDHYYVMSRFLLSRMLTAANVPKKQVSPWHEWKQKSEKKEPW